MQLSGCHMGMGDALTPGQGGLCVVRAMGKALGLWTVTAAVSSWNAALLEVKGAETQGAGRRGPSLGTGSQGKQHRTPKHAEEAEAGWMQRRHGLLKNASRVPELPSWGGAPLLRVGSPPRVGLPSSGGAPLLGVGLPGHRAHGVPAQRPAPKCRINASWSVSCAKGSDRPHKISFTYQHFPASLPGCTRHTTNTCHYFFTHC